MEMMEMIIKVMLGLMVDYENKLIELMGMPEYLKFSRDRHSDAFIQMINLLRKDLANGKR